MEMVYGKTKKDKNLQENGKLIKHMVMAFMLQKTVIIKVILLLKQVNLIYLKNMVMEYKHLLMETFIKDSIFMESLMATDSIHGKISQHIKVIL